MKKKGSRVAASLVGAVALISVMPGPAGLAQVSTRAGVTRQVDYSARYGFPDGRSLESSMSADGRFVAFATTAALIGVDNNNRSDIYLRDMEKGRIELISIGMRGDAATGTIPGVDIETTRWCPEDKGEWMFTGIPIGTTQREGLSWDPAISGNGRYVAFTSYASNLVPNDINLASDVFVFDRVRDDIKLVSADREGKPPSEYSMGDVQVCPSSWGASIDHDGDQIGFTSVAIDLLKENETEREPDVYVRYMDRDETELISVEHTERTEPLVVVPVCPPLLRPNLNSEYIGIACSEIKSEDTSISADGRWVAFDSNLDNLVPDDVNEASDVFVRDLQEKKTEIVSLSTDGQQGEAHIASPAGSEISGLGYNDPALAQHSISSDGRFVLFFSEDSGFVPNDDIDQPLDNPRGDGADVFIRDRKTDRTTRLSMDSLGEHHALANPWQAPGLSRNGRFSAFTGRLVASADYSEYRTFVYDRISGELEIVSRATSGAEAGRCGDLPAGGSPLHSPEINATGRFVTYSGCQTNLMEQPDPEGRYHVLYRDRGEVVGAGGLVDSGALQVEGSRSFSDSGLITALDEVVASKLPSGFDSAEDLVAARVVYRDTYDDLFVAIDVNAMPRLSLATNPLELARQITLLYSLHFTAGESDYELRVTGTPNGWGGFIGTFGLYRCEADDCSKVADLRGGYGTSGHGVTTAIPLKDVGLADGGVIRDVEAIASIGTQAVGAVSILDRLPLSSRD